MSEDMKLSTKTEATPILVSEGTSSNGALQLLADRYAKRRARIHKRMASENRKLTHNPAPYYTKAETAVRALCIDAT